MIRPAPAGDNVRTLTSLYRDKTSALVLDTVHTALRRPGILSPIIFCGPSGTGKTHLLQGVEAAAKALGHSAFVLNLSPWKSISYAEPSDLLLADGLHHLPGLTEDAREQFFAAFEGHFEHRKQIFFSSEIDPREIPMPARWQSRVFAGIVLDLRLPDRQDQLEFLSRKLSDFEMEVSLERLAALELPDGLSYRDLESVAAMVFLYSRNGWNDSRLGDALRARFRSEATQNARLLSIDDILKTVLKRFQVERADVLGKSRRAEHTLPRHIAMVLSLRYTGLNKSSIARFFQRSDHSIVIHAQKKIEEALEKDAALRQTFRRIARDLGVRVVDKK